VFGLELEIGVEPIDRLLESLRVSNNLAHGHLSIGRQQAFKRRGHNGYRLQWDMIPINELHVGSRAPATFGRGGAFAASTDGIATTRIIGYDRLEAECTVPVIDKIVEVGKALPTVSTQCSQRYLTRISIEAEATQPRAALLLPMHTEAVRWMSLQAKTMWRVAWRVASNMLLRMRSRRQIRGLIPWTTTRH
jgi:hypothetical protein